MAYYLKSHTIAITNDQGEVTDRVDEAWQCVDGRLLSNRLKGEKNGSLIGNSLNQYSPYGIVTHLQGNTDTPFLYSGQHGVLTDSNGLLYMRARYYNPTIRRFINADPIQFEGGTNWYLYANGNPILYVDPSGNIGIFGAGIGAGIDYAFQVGANFAQGDDFFESLIDVNVGSIAASAALGATGAGLGAVATGAIAKAGLSTAGRVGANALANGLIGSGLSTVDAIGRNQFRDEAHQIDVGQAALSGFIYSSLGSTAGDVFDIAKSKINTPITGSSHDLLRNSGTIQHYRNPNHPTTGQVIGLGVSNSKMRQPNK